MDDCFDIYMDVPKHGRTFVWVLYKIHHLFVFNYLSSIMKSKISKSPCFDLVIYNFIRQQWNDLSKVAINCFDKLIIQNI